MSMVRAIVFAIMALALGAPALAQSNAPALDPALIKDLVAANRILVNQGVIDVRGHVSLRDPADPNRFWISRAMPPGMVTAADMQAFDLDGKQVAGVKAEAYSERFIHARIYKARPDVKSVVHAHTRSVVTMSISGLPLKPVLRGATFFGASTPMVSGDAIHDSAGGDRAASAMGKAGAVIMQGHGVIVAGPSLQSAVGRSVTMDENAQALIAILQMHGAPSYLTPAPDAAAQPGNFDREWQWWKHAAGVE